MRILIMDFTPAGDGTATGELKSALLKGLRDTPIMQVSASDNARFEYAFPIEAPDRMQSATMDDLLAQIDWFSPTLILARPTAEREALWLLTLALWSRYDIPVITWIMDDWISVIGDPQKRATFEASLAAVFTVTGQGLSICDEMSDAFRARYNVPFTAIANGIDTEGEFSRFSPRISDTETPFVFRYAGSLAHNMGVDTLEKVARSVKRLRLDGLDVHLEIKTRNFWLQQQGQRFAGISGVSATRSRMGRYTYLSWLSEADCNLICYNFGDKTRRYVRYSLANKLPELLGVGAPVLGIGPSELPTIARLRDLGAGFHLSNASQEAVDRCLRDIVENRHRLHAVAKRGRDIAETAFDLNDIRERFVQTLTDAMASYGSASKRKTHPAVGAAKGFDTFSLPFDFRAVATPVQRLGAPPEPETPPHRRCTRSSVDEGKDDALPPRPGRGSIGQVEFDRARAETNTAHDSSAPVENESEPVNGLPLRPDRAGWGERPWLSGKADGAVALSRAARKTAAGRRRNFTRPDASLVDLDFRPAPNAFVRALNGANLETRSDGGFVVRRRGVQPGDHAALVPKLDRLVLGLRLDIRDLRGKADLIDSGTVLVSVAQTGTLDVAFDEPRDLQRLTIQCLENSHAKIDVKSITYRLAEAG